MKKLFFYFVLLVPVLTFAQALSGNHVIGQNQPAPFKTLTTAINHLKQATVGMSGPVTFLLDDEVYYSLPGESFPIVIPTIPTTAANTLTIKPNVGRTVTITATNPNGFTAIPAIFKFDGADNIIIDGSNSAGGSTKNLILQNNCNIPYALRSVVWIASNGTNGATNISVINTKIKMGVRNNLNTLTGIFSGGSAFPDFSATQPTGGFATAANSNTTIRNNEFFNVRQAIVVRSSADEAKRSANIQISLNTIGSTIEVEKPLMGIQVLNVKNSSIFDNTLNGLGRATVGGDNYLRGIDVINSTNIQVQRNVIENITFNSNSIIVYGIIVEGSSSIISVTENKVISIKTVDNGRIHGININTPTGSGILITNNFISGISSAGTFENTGYGIYMQNGGTSAKIYHNTVAMNAPQVGTSAAIYFASGSGYDVRNNIFQNSSKAQTLNGEGPYAIYSAIQPNAFANLNYNNYYSPNIGFINAGPAGGHNDPGVKPTFAIWKSAITSGTGNTGKDANSVSANPIFVSSTDLHLQSVAGNAALDNAGTLITVVPKDIDGQTRSTSTPDIGADEFSAVPVVNPTTPATLLTASTFTPTGLTLNWTNGNGTSRLVVARAATAVNALPVDGASYNANSIFGSGSQLGSGNYVVYSGSGSSVTVSGLSACTAYKIVVYEFNGSGTTSKYLTTNPATSTVGESTTYANGIWTKGKPNYFTEAIISSNITLSESLIACKLTVTATTEVVVPATFDVTLNGALTVESGASFTLASNTNLIQNTNAQNSGIINVQRKSSELFRLDYTMWGSPVTGSQTLKQFSPQTVDTRFYIYNTSSDQFNTIAPATNFTSGKGYLIRMPDNHPLIAAGGPATAWSGTFVGKPTNGDVTINVDSGLNGYNLLANPYASMLDAKKFLTDNSAVIDGTIYFWRRRNAVQDESAYYATYTYAGGTSVPSTTTSASGSETPNGFIQVGQGFIVKKKADATTGSVSFTNSMRTATNNDNQFFKNASIENSGRVWLNVTNAAGEFGQTLVAYLAEAENGLDFTDGKYLNDGSTALTSWLDNTEYIIQGRAPFESSDVVDLNFKTATAGTYTIAVDHVDGLFEVSQDIFLRDNVLNLLHDLKASSYTFATEAGSFNNRFDLVYQNPLAVDSPTFSSNSVVLFKNQNNIVINSGNNLLEMVEVFDIRGRVLAVAKNIQANEISINVGTTNQVLIVKITSADGITVTKKTIN